METDRELLELAAKAARLTCVWSPDRPDYERNQEQQPIYWNPLEDDGDALRLAVKLEMCVDFMDCRVIAGGLPEVVIDFAGKDYHRAIVRAAAEIGKGMV